MAVNIESYQWMQIEKTWIELSDRLDINGQGDICTAVNEGSQKVSDNIDFRTAKKQQLIWLWTQGQRVRAPAPLFGGLVPLTPPPTKHMLQITMPYNHPHEHERNTSEESGQQCIFTHHCVQCRTVRAIQCTVNVLITLQLGRVIRSRAQDGMTHTLTCAAVLNDSSLKITPITQA